MLQFIESLMNSIKFLTFILLYYILYNNNLYYILIVFYKISTYLLVTIRNFSNLFQLISWNNSP